MEISIANLSMGMSQASLQNAVSMSVLNLAMDSAQTQVSAMSEVLDSLATDPNLGSNIDVTI